MNGLQFRLDDPESAEALALLEAHLDHAYASSPPESVFALDPSKLAEPGIEFWTVWEGDECAGCGAVREIDPGVFEIKSMHTAAAFRGKGIGVAMVDHLVGRAREKGGRQVMLETGSNEAYLPARQMYRKYGFTERGPFKGYGNDPLSAFMELALD